MTRAQQALKIWQVLTGAAHNRQILTYEMVADLVGIGPEGKGAGVLAQPLGVLMTYCEKNGLPPITVLVVNKDTGKPGSGLRTLEELNADRERVFRYEWYRQQPLRLEDLEPYT